LLLLVYPIALKRDMIGKAWVQVQVKVKIKPKVQLVVEAKFAAC